jgi:hypothetical protein
MSKMKAANNPREDDFSLTDGGLMYRLLTSAGLITPDSPNRARRIVVISLLTWIPALILAVFGGVAWGSKVRIPFLLDFVAHIRFLIAVPLLIAAESIVDSRVKAYVNHFANSGLVQEDQIPVFKLAIAKAISWRDSTIAELIAFGLACAVISTYLMRWLPAEQGIWHALRTESGYQITLAGWWYALVSIPIFQFLCYRWLWRLIIWFRFLRHTSKLNLRLIPTHPDLAAGLGFLGITPTTFGIIPFALGTVLSAVLGREIIFHGASLSQFDAEIIGFVALSLLIDFGPLLIFTRKLAVVKRKGMLEYGALVNLHDHSFDRKWLRGDNFEGETILGNADASSLADLGVGYERIRNMRIVPFDLKTIISLAITALLPLTPLLLTVYPLDQLIAKIFEILI